MKEDMLDCIESFTLGIIVGAFILTTFIGGGW